MYHQTTATMKSIMTYAWQLKKQRSLFPFSVCLSMAHRIIREDFESRD